LFHPEDGNHQYEPSGQLHLGYRFIHLRDGRKRGPRRFWSRRWTKRFRIPIEEVHPTFYAESAR